MNRIILLILLVVNVPLIAQKHDGMDSLEFVINEKYTEFKYRERVGFRAEEEVYLPINFDIKLPNGILDWNASYFSNFVFVYDDDQVIFLSTDIFKERPTADTAYSMDCSSVYHILESDFTKFTNEQYNNYQYLIDNERVNFVIYKNRSVILLFNIKDENFDKFKELVISYEEYQK
jgi:hypothetical protein